MNKKVEISKSRRGVVVITMNRPDNLNALTAELARELHEAILKVESRPSARVVVIRGAGRAFSSGGDVKAMAASLDHDPEAFMDELTREVYGLIRKVLDTDLIAIAQVRGAAYGAAMNLVLACDLAVASTDAVFRESFLRLGLIPGGLATALLGRIVGGRGASDLCLTAREVGAGEAMFMGIVNFLAAPEDLESETMKLAEQVAAMPPRALALAKKLLAEAWLNPPGVQSELERKTQIEMAGTADFAEGVKAFLARRKPRFRGK